MRQRKGPPVKKFSYYVPPAVGQGFGDFSGDAPSAHIVGAQVAWMALPADAREKILAAANSLPVDKAVATARRTIRDAMGEMILLEHARSLPKAEKAKIIQKSLAK